MLGVAFLFFFTAALCVAVGMTWGIIMGVSGDHSLAPAHAHLNLVGWVTMALFGTYYHLVPAASAMRLAKIHYAVALAGVALMVPGIAIVHGGGRGDALAGAGSLLTIISMLIFAFTVWRTSAVSVTR